MATTTRLPDELKAEAERYAQGLGISLNALMAVALRDYLDRRSFLQAKAAQTPVAAVAELVYRQPPGGPRAPCPCQSGQQWRHCHGKAA